ncbi:hypothetical protein BC834DRAFT_670529 [Gloeopeniophorella convolvens]|nr:hypothetical protein BC834DRAFT_670529 [Gloeopeniophorella convolvens]
MEALTPSGLDDYNVWDAKIRDCRRTIQESIPGHSSVVNEVSPHTRVIAPFEPKILQRGRFLPRPHRLHFGTTCSRPMDAYCLRLQVCSITKNLVARRVSGCSSTALSIALPPDGKRIVSRSDGCAILIWDVATAFLVTVGPFERNGHVRLVTVP